MSLPFARRVVRQCSLGRCAVAMLLTASPLLVSCAGRVITPTHAAPVPQADIVATVILIGDAGAPSTDEPVFRALRRTLVSRPDSAVILFLGDNVYPIGLPDSSDPSFGEAARRLQAQLDLADAAPLVFIPGNHDWHRSGPEGWARVRREGRFIARVGAGRARMLPTDGCPGPDTLNVAPGLQLVLLDTEWWLFPHDKPAAQSACPARSRHEVIAALDRSLRATRGRQVIVAGHHPLRTGGPHGGYFSLGDHLFPLRHIHPALLVPLPIIGSLYPIIRDAGVSAEDVHGAPYRVLRAGLDSAFACAPPAVYASGHEHTLQVIGGPRAPVLAVSGSGYFGHGSHVERITGTRVATGQAGFMRADLLRDGRLRLGVITVDDEGEPREVYAEFIAAAGERTSDCDP